MWPIAKANIEKKVVGGVSGALHDASNHRKLSRKRANQLLRIGRNIGSGAFQGTIGEKWPALWNRT